MALCGGPSRAVSIQLPCPVRCHTGAVLAAASPCWSGVAAVRCWPWCCVPWCRRAAGAVLSCVPCSATVQVVPEDAQRAAPGRSTATACPVRCARQLLAVLPWGLAGAQALLALLVASALAGKGPAWGSPASGFFCTAVPYIVKKDSCYRHILPSMMDVMFPNSEQLWPLALWRKETVLRVQAAEHPLWKCPSLLSSLQQTCLHCSLTFFFLYFYFCMSFAFQIL